MIHLKNVYKSYNSGVTALSGVNLHIKPKDFVSVVGQSGMGKTTLAKLMIAQERPNKGRVVIGGWDITDIKDYQIPTLRRQIGVVFQDLYLLSDKTVYENVAFALEACGSPTKKIKKIVPQVLQLVGLLDKKDRYPRQLSGGEKQKVVLARSVVNRPKILIADEPTGNLDAINTEEIINLLLKINKFGTTVVLITHDREIVNSLNKRVIALEQGKVISDKKTGKYTL
ncbi:MAG TPA: cell division ATP-binding protein FtsE [Patescibacteria group bacterium]